MPAVAGRSRQVPLFRPSAHKSRTVKKRMNETCPRETHARGYAYTHTWTHTCACMRTHTQLQSVRAFSFFFFFWTPEHPITTEIINTPESNKMAEPGEQRRVSFGTSPRARQLDLLNMAQQFPLCELETELSALRCFSEEYTIFELQFTIEHPVFLTRHLIVRR